MALITTAEAAKKLGVHQTRVQVLIRAGRLPAQRMGGTYIIEETDLLLVLNRPIGRPRKEAAVEIAPGGRKWKAAQITLPAVAPTKKTPAKRTPAPKTKAVATKKAKR